MVPWKPLWPHPLHDTKLNSTTESQSQWSLISSYHPNDQMICCKGMMSTTRVITLYTTYFWTVPLPPVFQTPFGNQISFCHHMSGKVPTQLGLSKRATDSISKVCLKNQYNEHYPQFTVTMHHANHLVLSEATNSICDGTLTQFNLWWYTNPIQFVMVH
jgi:hypothetical protein